MSAHAFAAGVALAAVVGCAATREAERPPLVEVAGGGYAMGTALELTLLGRDEAALDAARVDVFTEVHRLEIQLSRWIPKSDVSRLNAAAGGTPLELHPEVVELLRRSQDFNRITIGAFDVTVGPLLALWQRAEERGALPSEAELEAARARVGPHRLRLDSAGRASLAAGSTLDLGAIAKGYALDRVRAGLPAAVEAALLNFGRSSTWAVGSPPGSEGWRLLVEAPGGGYAGVLTLRDRALSASGSLGQWREIEGRRYGHVVDPRSGRPLTRRLQALVVAGDATTAEALSTAVVVLGERDGLELAQSLTGVEALLLDAEGGSWRTAGWDRVTHFKSFPPP